MNTAVINIKVEPKVKIKAQAVAEDLGISLSSLIHAFLKQLITTKAVSFSVAEEPTDWLLQQLRESKEDIKTGRVKSFADSASAIKYVDKLIENDKNHKKN